MKVLVTGANGLVGSRVVGLLRSRGHDVVATGSGPKRLKAEVPYVAADLADAAAIRQLVTSTAPNAIINSGAKTDVDGCERDPAGAWGANVTGVAAMALAATEVGAHLVHVSTDYVFDGEAGPYATSAIPNPRGHYAVSKYAGELAVRTLCAPERWSIARTAVVYGWPATGKNNFGSWLLDSFRNGKSVKLFADQWVSPSLASNVAAMLVELAERALPGLWHTSGAEVVDRVTFGRALCERFGFDAALIQPSRMKDVALASFRPPKSGLDVSATMAALTEKPLSLGAALERFHAEYRESP